jgi:hypothetical protein
VRFLLSTAFLLCGLGVAARLAWAELAFRSDSASQTQAALRYLGSTPNASYAERLADLVPGAETQYLTQALEANPRLTSARIALGLLEEGKGDFVSAEQTLLQAAHYDRQYLPAWTLANYYFRRENADNFWQWARRAAQLNNDNPRPLLRLASLEEPDPKNVLDRLQAGDNIAYAYLDLLIGSGRLDAAQALVPILLRSKVVRKNQLVDLTTRQLQAGHVSWALEIWNALCDADSACVSLDPEHGPFLSPGLSKPDGEGFHPSLTPNSGIAAEWGPNEAAFTMDGTQPDLCPLLEQPVPAPRRGGKHYRLRYEYESSATGAYWSMAGFDSPALAPSPDWHRAEMTISPRAEAGKDSLRLLKLRLVYRRELGAIPAVGEFRLRNLQLTIS